MIDIDNTSLQYLHGVGPKRAKILSDELSVCTLRDLLFVFPYKHIDRSRIYTINELSSEMPFVQICGQFVSFETVGEGRKRRLIAHFTDGSGFVDLIWFNNINRIQNYYKFRTNYIVFGKPTAYGGRINISHPEIDPADGHLRYFTGLCPVYSVTEKMRRHALDSRALSRIICSLLESLDEPITETLPSSTIKALQLMSLDAALRNIHHSTSSTTLKVAIYRLKFEELFFIQLNILRFAHQRSLRYRGFVFNRIGETFHRFYDDILPFRLTDAQKHVIREIRKDFCSGRQMNRLLQGDVGSGKTIVALLCMLIAVDNRFQTAIIAPTEILAEQHFKFFTEMLSSLPLHVELLTGSVRGHRRQNILNGLADGSINILVATHAAFEENVVFHSLGFVVIDEQHRFGVAQRATMWQKNTTPPHMLVMTATPIPRTLAMTLYGDLDVSVINELPPGRKAIRTVHLYESSRKELIDGIRSQLNQGRQVYVVYPLIKESENSDLKDLESGYEQLRAELPDYVVGKVHGRMSSLEKEVVMKAFIAHEIHILVSTTVIEVGVNVPNASVMVIQSAERFGLAQLHQLRGRVGRGTEQSYCILVTQYKLSEATRRRIEIMTQTTDGFEIAEADMRLRGPGDMEGTQQSGFPFTLRLANLTSDVDILEKARAIAAQILNSDPTCENPENRAMFLNAERIRKQSGDWSSIS